MNQRTFRNEARDDYLETILLVLKAKGHCRAIHVAAELGVSKPSVSVELSKLLAEGYISLDEDKMINLTEAGQALAELTYSKHCYFRDLLLSAGIDAELAEKEACAMEHAVSSDSFQKIRARYPIV